MALYKIKQCPKCRSIIEYGHDRRGIGVPFKRCSACKTIIIDKDTTEWELKSFISKACYFFICAWTSMLFGLFFPLAALAFSKYIMKKETTNETFLLLYLYPAGVVVFAMLSVILESKSIRNSKGRMKDKGYRLLLTQMGLLKNEDTKL